MDLQNIEEQLNTEFAKSTTRIVFWFDDKGEYEDEVSELNLPGVERHALTGTNWLYSKWLLNESKPDSKFLVYAPFPKPSDAENPLADMYYYSVPYYTDRISQMCQELGIDNKFKEQLAQFGTFFRSQVRIRKFMELSIDHYTVETIHIGLLAVLADVKTPNFEKIVKQLILGDSKKYIKSFEDYGILNEFWNLCKKQFGYEPKTPNVDDLAACLILTYASTTLKSTIPASMKSYVLKKRNDAAVFIRNIMDNVLYREAYDRLADKVNQTLRFTGRIEADLKKETDSSKTQAVQMEDIFACDAFKGLDDLIIHWILERLNDEILDAQIDGFNIAQIAEQRTSLSYHYGEVYRQEYMTCKYAYLMMKSVSLMEFTSDIEKLVENYQKETYLIDSYYRWFYTAYDQLEDNERFSAIRERVENIYSNTYLQKLTPKWNLNFTDETINNLGLNWQEDFYKQYIRPYENKESRVIVIISDALRYECARELLSRLEYDEKCEPKLTCMLGSLPSVTSVGMASLLPHEKLTVDKDMNVTIDGQSCGDMVSRDKIMKKQNAGNVALSFDEVAGANQATIRELLQGKRIVYIYHNQVDARGDKPASENEVFNACAEAVEEIHRLIRKLSGYVSASKFFITADHGFLYKRDRLQEFDKVSYPKEICTYSNKRFLLTTESVNQQGVASRMMAYMDKLYVTTPIGADIFKVAGGGQNYVHGGTSLQEMLIPVIELTMNTRGVAVDFVDVNLTSISRKVTNLITYFDFIQTEKVTDTVKARNIVAYFTTESGEKISFDVPIAANSKEDAPEKRMFHEKFTLKSREYKSSDKYYMVLVDANDEKNILQQYEFMIDIAFVDDFGF